MTAPLYAADPPAARVAIALDTLTALFHRPSGATHLLAPPAPELLDALAEGPADAATVLDRLVGEYDIADAAIDVVTARLEELVAVGLAWRV